MSRYFLVTISLYHYNLGYINKKGELALKATGIVVEYNPFHNGHLFHVEQAKKQTNADIVIAVMSGNFLQRGEPAFVDKWTRTKMALASGVDLVIELPYAFATAHASLFAEGAIRLLDAVRCDSFCFGSENGDIHSFHSTLQLLADEQSNYQAIVREAVRSGKSYPAALQQAFQQVTADSPRALVDLSQPNNILGFHYMEAASNFHTTMTPYTIKRLGAQYHDTAVTKSKIASATAIRHSYFSSSDLTTISNVIPRLSLPYLQHALNEQQPGSWELFYPLLRYTLVREGIEKIASIADIVEGIEHLLYRAARTAPTFEQFMQEVKSKRYTWTRIQRMLVHCFTGFTKEMRETMPEPAYLRLLGMTTKGRRYVKEHKEQFTLPLISKVSAFEHPALQLDCSIADLYSLAVSKPAHKSYADYQLPPIIFS